jgi:2-methylisocitrate lyase-like PEP mutase family enzyme
MYGTIERAQAYAKADAVWLLCTSLADIALIARLLKESPLPLNIIVGDANPSVRLLAENGVAR